MSEASLYFTEFTMPDGSKRPPLLNRMRNEQEDRWEMWPAGLVISRLGGTPTNYALRTTVPYDDSEDADNLGAFANNIQPEHAAALCRCAVEDWLMSEERSGVFLFRGSTQHIVTVGPERSPDVPPTVGPTIHHALIAAAHAVLDQTIGDSTKRD